MKLTEQHVIDRDDPRFALIDAAAFKSKNLYFGGRRLSGLCSSPLTTFRVNSTTSIERVE
jgi:hypothetical protein